MSSDDYVDMAFTGRCGPAVLLVPLDLLDELPDLSPDAPRRQADLGSYPLDRSMADPARIAEAADLLAGARTPVVIAGGVHSSGVAAELTTLRLIQ